MTIKWVNRSSLTGYVGARNFEPVDPIGTERDPASSLSDLRAFYSANYGTTPPNGSYWIKPGSTSFQTYCLFSGIDGNDWMLMFMFNTDDESLDYDSDYWSTRNPYNVSVSSLDYTVNTASNVATGVVNNYPFRYLAVTNYSGNGNLNTYYLGSASNNQANLLTAYTSAYISTGSKVGSGTLSIPLDAPNLGTGGSRLMYNQSQSVTSGTAYARFGQAQGTEPFGGNYYTHRAYGVGCKTSHVCGGSYSRDFDFGTASGRHSAGGCGDNPSATGSFLGYEIWVR